MTESKKFQTVDFAQLKEIPCPCGLTKRAFLNDVDQTASFHIVKIKKKSRKHYHKKTTEIYYVLEGDGFMELDDDKIPLKKGISVMIKPGCRHRALGDLTIINVPVPCFDEEDEWFD